MPEVVPGLLRGVSEGGRAGRAGPGRAGPRRQEAEWAAAGRRRSEGAAIWGR